MALGGEIRRRRKAKGWTLEDLAHKSGLTEHYLSTVENDARDPSLSTMRAVSKALGVSLGELFGGSGKVSSAALEAARLFDAAGEEIQEGVLRILRASARRRR